MILGTVTVYICDETGCSAHTTIPSDKIATEPTKWQIGVYKHFCAQHRIDRNAVPSYRKRRRMSEPGAVATGSDRNPKSTPEAHHV